MNSSLAPYEFSLIIPAFNEELRIIKSLETLQAYIQKSSALFEIIFVDDGSTDNTVNVVTKFCDKHSLPIQIKSHITNIGKGVAVQTGFSLAKSSWVIITDADLSTPLEEIEKLLSYKNAFPIVIGSRALDRSLIEDPQPFYRDFMGRAFNWLVQLLLLPGIKDTQCGFKAFNKPLTKQIFDTLATPGFAFDVEVLYKAKLQGLAVKEVPVRWHNVLGSRVSPIKDSLSMFFSILRIRFFAKV
jgi:dolichyl-phosphate beta-glucosyltransferase